MLSMTENLSLVLIFIEGVFSFFSPCILPLLPVYISYLSFNAKIVKEDGTIIFKQSKVFLYTLFFILGISVSFLILGFSFTALGTYFQDHRDIISKVSGILIIFLGIVQLGIINIPFMNKEFRMNFGDRFQRMSLPMAFVLGFMFSFAWTPCVGPALSSVLIMAGNSSSTALSIAYILIYTIGFLLPFIALGLFTTKILSFLKKYHNLVKYTIKVGGVILIIIGCMLFIDIGSSTTDSDTQPQTQKEEKLPAIDFTVTDQNEIVHSLSEYKGKVVFLNFWATWCGYCKKELPYIEEVYQEYAQNNDDVIILSMVVPGGKELNQTEIKQFIEEQGITFPVLFDNGKSFNSYRVNSLPTTYMIDRDGNIFGRINGGLNKETIKSIIQQTIDGESKPIQ